MWDYKGNQFYGTTMTNYFKINLLYMYFFIIIQNKSSSGSSNYCYFQENLNVNDILRYLKQ